MKRILSPSTPVPDVRSLRLFSDLGTSDLAGLIMTIRASIVQHIRLLATRQLNEAGPSLGDLRSLCKGMVFVDGAESGLPTSSPFFDLEKREFSARFAEPAMSGISTLIFAAYIEKVLQAVVVDKRVIAMQRGEDGLTGLCDAVARLLNGISWTMRAGVIQGQKSVSSGGMGMCFMTNESGIHFTGTAS